MKLNKYGVCERPKCETIYKQGKFVAKVFFAAHNGLWAYGYDFEIKGMGTGCFRASGLPGFGKYRKPFACKDAARRHAIHIGIRHFEQASDKFNVKPVVKALKMALQPQLTLF
jgi:hypothetical protein